MSIFSRKKDDDFFVIPIEPGTAPAFSENTDISNDTDIILPTNNSSDELPRMNFSSTHSDPLDSLKNRMRIPTAEKESEKSASRKNSSFSSAENSESSKKTLLERLQRYTVDEQGHNLAEQEKPAYTLETVSEILGGEQNDSKQEEKTEEKPIPIKSEAPEVPQNAVMPTPAFKKMVSDSQKNTEQHLLDELFPKEDMSVPRDIKIPDISDIDNSAADRPYEENNTSNTATIKFTPVKDDESGTGHISISSITRPLDIAGDLEETVNLTESISDEESEESEFDKFSPSQEASDAESTKKLLRRFALKKRTRFLCLCASFLFTFIMLLFCIGPLSDFLISNVSAAMTVCTVILSLSVLVNIDMFVDFSRLFTKKCGSDVLAALSALSTVIYGIFSAIDGNNAYFMLLTGSFIMLIRSLTAFFDISSLLGNLKQIAVKQQKNAVSFISDSSTALAMAKNSIDGDILIAAPRKARQIDGFMKFSQFSSKFSGKMPILTITVLLLSAVAGIIASVYYTERILGIYTVSALLCIASIPTLFFTDTLPIRRASVKLNRFGAMIAGLEAADKLELANAAVISSADIFPPETVTLKSMKVLSDSNVDDIILRAASLTEALNSPLYPIFKRIAGTNSSYSVPSSDTVKYEERLGISGWVNNEPLFIGNRTLMQAHGISVPGIEVDRQILRKGYFPIYVASSNKACVLIIVEYTANQKIAKELRKITGMGVTLLVENTDPNISQEMICDYFELYDDSLRVMTNAGVKMYKNATVPVKSLISPAAFRNDPLNFIRIINSASRMKKSNLLLTVLYVVLAVLATVYFAYAAFSGAGALPPAASVFLYQLAAAAVSLILFFAV